MRTVSFGISAILLMLIGCSKDASSAAADSPPAKDDACALLSLAEIRRILPEASRAVHNDALVSQGIDACGWYGSSKAPVLEVSVWQVSGDDDTPRENASTLAMGIADPTRAGAEAEVRLETVTGVGEDAVAIVEKTDAARGILTTAALLTLQKNGRIATVASSDIATGERSKALEQLATLGKALAARL